MRHPFIQFAAAAALTAASLGTAGAHASLEKAEAAPGSYKAVVRIGHGCDGQPTRSVRVEVPEGYIDVHPQPKAGWSLAIERGDYAHAYTLHGREIAAGATAVTWSGGTLDDTHYDEFVMAGTLAKDTGGTTLFFKTVQTCPDASLAWDQIPTPGQNPHALNRPAPGLVVLASGDGHGGSDGHAHGAAAGADVIAGDLEIGAAWARAMLAGQKAAGAYLTVTNTGAEADRLVGGASARAGKVEVHTMEVVNDVMTMRPVEGGLDIPAGGTVELKPGGIHVMLMDVATPFAEGETVPVTLTFEKAGNVELSLPVRAVKGAGGGAGHGQDHGQSHD